MWGKSPEEAGFIDMSYPLECEGCWEAGLVSKALQPGVGN